MAPDGSMLGPSPLRHWADLYGNRHRSEAAGRAGAQPAWGCGGSELKHTRLSRGVLKRDDSYRE